ncbi:MAG: DNA repair protein RecO [Elusimicrobia bacterium]|nr:DNA repair protein RecO [Elusimicrobiota bacterium]
MSELNPVKVRAVVLASRSAGEADKLLTLYTYELGKVRARAVSAGRTTAKLLGATEPFVESELMVFLRPGSSWGKITGGRLLRCYPTLYTGWTATTEASELCELLDRLTPDQQSSPDKFELICQALAQVAREPHPAIRWAFALRLLVLAGFGLRLDGCLRCGPAETALWLAPAVGGLLCAVHAGRGDKRMLVSPAVQERLRWLATIPWEAIRSKTWSPEATGFLEQLIDQCLTPHLTRPLRSAQFRMQLA